MPAVEGIKIEGLKELYKTLEQLPVKFRGSMLRKANKKILAVYPKALKSAIKSKNFKTIAKPEHVIIKNDKYNLSGVIASLSTDAFKLRFYLQGTKERFTKKYRGVKLKRQAGKGKMPANDFITPVVEDAEKQITRALEDDYEKMLYRSLVQTNRYIKKKNG